MTTPKRPRKRAKQRKPTVYLSVEAKAQMLAEADRAPAEEVIKRWNVSKRTLELARAAMRTNAELAGLYAARKQAMQNRWLEEGRRFLEAGMKKLTELIEHADQKQLRDVAGAVHLITQHVNAATVLGVEQLAQPADAPAAEKPDVVRPVPADPAAAEPAEAGRATPPDAGGCSGHSEHPAALH